MNEQLNVLLTYYTNAEKETIFFFLLRLCFLALVCYDLELDCCIKKTLYDCKVCSKKRFQTFVSRKLGLPTADEMKVCLAQKKELEEKVVESEKRLLVRKNAFVQSQKKIASLKIDLSKTGTKVEWLYEEVENTEDKKQAILKSNWNNKSFYFVKEEEAEKKNELLRQELMELKLFEAQQHMAFV